MTTRLSVSIEVSIRYVDGVHICHCGTPKFDMKSLKLASTLSGTIFYPYCYWDAIGDGSCVECFSDFLRYISEVLHLCVCIG